MRFIRVHGRVVPIKDGGSSKQRGGSHPLVLATPPAAIAGVAILGVQTGHITAPSKIMGEKSARYGIRANRMLAKSGPLAARAKELGSAAKQFKSSPASDAMLKSARFQFKSVHMAEQSLRSEKAGLTLGKLSSRAGKIARILRKVRL